MNAAVAEAGTAPTAAADDLLGIQGDADANGEDRILAAFDRGVMLERTGDVPGAILAYEEAWASTADPGVSRAAGRALDRLRRTNPVVGEGQLEDDERGGIELYQAGRYAEAIEVWEYAQVHTRGNDPAIQYNMAMAYEHVGRTREAVAMFAMLQDHRGADAEMASLVQAALTRLRSGTPPESHAETTAAPEDAAGFDAMEERAGEAMAQGHFGQAADLYMTLADSPLAGNRRGELWFNLGQVWRELGVADRARKAFLAAIDSGQLDEAGTAMASQNLRAVGGQPPAAAAGR